MKVLLDSNVWRYVANERANEALERCAIDAGVQLAVAPVLVSEVRDLKDDITRRSILRLLTQPGFIRLMPEAFLEAQEIKAAIGCFRREWLIASPDLSEVHRLEDDWRRSDGGFWSRASDDFLPPVTDESARAAREHALAREESRKIRAEVIDRKESLPQVSLREVYGVPPEALPGWLGDPVEYWRVPSLYHLQSELAVYTSPYREWLDAEVDVSKISESPESLTKLWYYEIYPQQVPRQWVRGAFEFLQCFHKVLTCPRS